MSTVAKEPDGELAKRLDKLETTRLQIIQALHNAERHRPRDHGSFVREYLEHPDAFAAGKSYKKALERLRERLATAMQALLEEGELTGVAVFFSPETNRPLPFFYGKLSAWDGASLPQEAKMRESISEISTILRKEWPRPPDRTTETHFFVWMKSVLDATRSGIAPIPGTGITILGSTVVIFPDNQPTNHFQISLGDKKLTWEPVAKYPPFMATPVHVDADTYVLIATFFPGATRETVFRHAHWHSMASHYSFSPIFHFIVNESRQMLRDKLARDLIETTLLQRAARELGKNRCAFTYEWKDHDCSDLEYFIRNELESNPRDLFELVIELQESIYGHLRQEWDIHRGALQGLGFNQDNPLPETMPFGRTLKDIERAQRAMGKATRDHVVHQFQVSLLGLFVMNRCANDLVRVAAEQFPTPAENRTDSDVDQPSGGSDGKARWEILSDAEKGAVRYLLRLSWFLASNFHDIGYPIEKVNDVVEGLQQETAQLLRLNPRLIPSVSRFSIESVLYDEPRTYILAKHLAACLAESIEMGEKETWYFLRNCLFYLREHAAVSAVVLGLAFIPKDVDTNSMAEFLEESRFGWLLTHYVLLPILVHHAGEWARYTQERIVEADEACRSEMQANKQRQRTDTAEKEKTRRIKKELGSLFKGVGTSRPSPRYRLSFERNPIGNVLAYCDIVQEDGRPMGVATAVLDWSAGISGMLDSCGRSPRHLRYNVVFSGKDAKWKEEEVERAKAVFDWRSLSDLFCTAFFEAPQSKKWFASVTFSKRHKCNDCDWCQKGG